MGLILKSTSEDVDVELRRSSFKIYGDRGEFVELDYKTYIPLMLLLTSAEMLDSLEPDQKFLLKRLTNQQ